MLRRLGTGALVCALAFALAIEIGSVPTGEAVASARQGGASGPAQVVDPGTDEAPPPPPGPPSQYVVPTETYDGRLTDPALQELVDEAKGNGVSTDTALVEVLFSDEAQGLAALAAVGATDVAYAGQGMRLARVPVDELVRLEGTPAIDSIREPVTVAVAPGDDTAALAQALPAAIAGTKGGDLASKVKIASWHTRGYNGTGVKVGIIDLWNKSMFDSARAAKEVPAYGGAICRSNGAACSTFWRYGSTVGNHGVAVMEAIHDLAPGAKIYIADADTMADYYAVIDYFYAQGVRIISRSLAAKYDGPGNGTGDFAELVDYAVAKGMTWLNAAGNSGARSAEVGGYWRGPWRDVDSDGWIEFLAPDGSAYDYLPGSCSYLMGLRWSDWGANPTDYDIYFFSQTGEVMAWSAMRQSAGAPPLEAHQNGGWCTSGQSYFYAAIWRNSAGSGSTGDVLEVLSNGLLYDAVSSPGSAGQPVADSANPGAAAVGAIDPVGGSVIAPYSSQGPLNDGRIKPDFSAASNYTSYSYRASTGRFNGTSAATPAVSGMAAVLLQKYPSYTPAQLVALLKSQHVIDRGATGLDPVYGEGEVILDSLFTTMPTPRLSGTVKEGSTLTANLGTWVPTPTTFSYQWYREATAIPGATSKTYRLTSADAGNRIRVTVTPVRSGFVSERKNSAYTAKVEALKTFTTSPTPRIAGTPSPGSNLTALVGTWKPVPTSFAYVWLRDGVAIPGATAKTYKVTSADAGTQLTVRVTAKLSGYRWSTKTSAPVTVPG